MMINSVLNINIYIIIYICIYIDNKWWLNLYDYDLIKAASAVPAGQLQRQWRPPNCLCRVRQDASPGACARSGGVFTSVGNLPQSWKNDPLINIQKAIENGHRNSGFTHDKWWFSVVLLVYQKVMGASTSPLLNLWPVWEIAKTTKIWIEVCPS